MTKQSEHRRFSRHLLDVEIQIGDQSLGGELQFESRDFSAGGVFLKSDLLFEKGEVLLLSFVLPSASFAIRTRGRVVRVDKDAQAEDGTSASGMGIEFLDLSEAEKAALVAHLAD